MLGLLHLSPCFATKAPLNRPASSGSDGEVEARTGPGAERSCQQGALGPGLPGKKRTQRLGWDRSEERGKLLALGGGKGCVTGKKAAEPRQAVGLAPGRPLEQPGRRRQGHPLNPSARRVSSRRCRRLVRAPQAGAGGATEGRAEGGPGRGAGRLAPGGGAGGRWPRPSSGSRGARSLPDVSPARGASPAAPALQRAGTTRPTFERSPHLAPLPGALGSCVRPGQGRRPGSRAG